MAKLRAWEKVDIYNCTNGERFSTYVIPGEKGQIGLNGAAARKVAVNDVLILIVYGFMDFEEAKSFKPWLIFPDVETNTVV